MKQTNVDNKNVYVASSCQAKKRYIFLKLPYLDLHILYYNTHKQMMSFLIRVQMLIKLLATLAQNKETHTHCVPNSQ